MIYLSSKKHCTRIIHLKKLSVRVSSTRRFMFPKQSTFFTVYNNLCCSSGFLFNYCTQKSILIQRNSKITKHSNSLTKFFKFFNTHLVLRESTTQRFYRLSIGSTLIVHTFTSNRMECISDYSRMHWNGKLHIFSSTSHTTEGNFNTKKYSNLLWEKLCSQLLLTIFQRYLTHIASSTMFPLNFMISLLPLKRNMRARADSSASNDDVLTTIDISYTHTHTHTHTYILPFTISDSMLKNLFRQNVL